MYIILVAETGHSSQCSVCDSDCKNCVCDTDLIDRLILIDETTLDRLTYPTYGLRVL